MAGSAMIPRDARLRRGSLAIWDVLCWVLAPLVVIGTRYDFELSRVLWTEVVLFTAVAIALQLCLGWLSKLYQGRYRVGSYEEVLSLGGISLIEWGLLCAGFLTTRESMPRGLVVMASFAALLAMAAGRFLMRAVATRHVPGDPEKVSEPVLIYGAGNAGVQIARLLDQDPDAPYAVHGFIDDDRRKRHLHIGRHRVLGTGDDVLRQADAEGVQTVILAITTASRDDRLGEYLVNFPKSCTGPNC